MILLEHEVDDAYVLLNGMFATQLPPLLDHIITPGSSSALIEELALHSKEKMFEVDSKTNLLTKFIKGIKPPKNIYGGNWATEEITFYTLKVDESWRPMGIPNIKHVLMFAYNNLIIANLFFNPMYNKNNRLSGITKHSESPIIGRDGSFSEMLYEEFENLWFDDDSDFTDIDESSTNEGLNPIGFIGYSDQNKFFKESRLQRYRIEATYPYILHLDISKYFENIYTHLFSQINPKSFISQEDTTIFETYLHWLDEYNQKINNNHTKGIVQGPISSKISAEILQLSLDKKIEAAVLDLNLDVTFTRYVDDYRFFGRNIKDLELLKNKVIKIFRQHELSFNENKIKLYKGFEQQKQAQLEKYSKLQMMIKGRNIQFSFNDYLIFREILVQVINEKDLPTAKAILTIFTQRIEKKQIVIKDQSLIIPLIQFLIKIAYVYPVISMQTYKFLNAIGGILDADYRKKVWKILFEEMKFVIASYSDTDFEAWFFYTLANIGTANKTYEVVNEYLKNVEENASVIILSVLLKKRSKRANKRIHDYIVNQIGDWQTVSQSKWWLPISKLWLVKNDLIIDKRMRELFLSRRKNSLQWDKLGIIEFLNTNTFKTDFKI